MASSSSTPITVGVLTDLTGALSFMGTANANVAELVVDEINATGGLLGRRLELIVEDTATDDAVAAAAATRLVTDHDPDVVLGGIYSSTRQAIKGPVVDHARKLYIYPEQYEGQECHPLIFCTGPVPAQQIEPLFPWLMDETGARTFYLPSADYIWPHVLNAKVHEVVEARGGSIVGEEYHPMDHMDFAATVERIMDSGADVVFNTIVPPGLTPFLALLHEAGFTERDGTIVCTYFDENFLNLVPAEHVEGLYGCLDFYRSVADPFSTALLTEYDRRFPGSAQFTAGSACTGMYRGLQLWASAVTTAGSVDTDAVVKALDSASLEEGPGGPAEMVPGQHHLRLNMYIARARSGAFEVVKNLGRVDPKECTNGCR